ncbi:hypothetical protein L208DRAFT_1203220, partial [Tricholoma matsutake]
YAPASFWIHPPEPVISLSNYRFDPQTLYRPRIFLWLPHFYVTELRCPKCSGLLEKNGALAPRRITDVEDNFYIVTWGYYCQKGCHSHFHGWSDKFLSTLPAYLHLSFPAILSYNGGLSHKVITQLYIGNQHKTGPNGVHSLLCEMHTLRFNTIQLQYLEALFDLVHGHQVDADAIQTTLHDHFGNSVPSFGNFSDHQKYAGFLLSEHYLAKMMMKAIERSEPDANQHTACLAPDQIAIDNSHKINKHIAKVDGVPIFGALWTCMSSRYIRAQALTLTKAHEERIGPLSAIANSAKCYRHSDPVVAFSDDPVKDKKLTYSAFPSLSQNITPASAPSGLQHLELSASLSISVLSTPDLTEKAMSSLLAPLDLDSNAHLCVSLDAEWNI